MESNTCRHKSTSITWLLQTPPQNTLFYLSIIFSSPSYSIASLIWFFFNLGALPNVLHYITALPSYLSIGYWRCSQTTATDSESAKHSNHKLVSWANTRRSYCVNARLPHCRLREISSISSIYVTDRKLNSIFHLHLRPVRWSSSNFVTPISLRKLECWHYQAMKEFQRQINPSWHGLWRTDRQTPFDNKYRA